MTNPRGEMIMRGVMTMVLLLTWGMAMGFDRLPSNEVLDSYNWAVKFEEKGNPQKTINLSKASFQMETQGNGKLKYSHADAEVTLEWKYADHALSVTSTVKNKKKNHLLTSIIGPLIPIDKQIEEYNLLMPIGFGERFLKTPQDDEWFSKPHLSKEFSWKKNSPGNYYEVTSGGNVPAFPSRTMTMQWCAFAGAKDGIYIATHDAAFNLKRLGIRYYPEEKVYRIAVRHHKILYPGEQFTTPTLQVKTYQGDWHKAADMYRHWFESVRPCVEKPSWLKKSTGWLLTILKQQNDEIIWPYTELSNKLADAAEKRGLDIVGLFGWTIGGHDRFYPEYQVCQKMGGETELRKALAELKKRNMHAIIYVNGQLIDQNGTSFWEKTGKHITMVNGDKTYNSETWHKYHDAPARTHGRACHQCGVWRDSMLSFAKKANSLGADGIIYDQLGNREPIFCYSKEHGHRVPEITFGNDVFDNLEYVRQEMAKVNPHFIVITEGTKPEEMSGTDMFHGCTYGVYDMTQAYADDMTTMALPFHAFPEILKYTLPQIDCTVRHPSPVADRMLLNYGTIYGFKHEIETRYAADKRYLLEDRIPSLDDYGNVREKPNIDMVTTEDPQRQTLYSKQMQDFRRRYSEFLLEGTFKDNQGFSVQTLNPALVAKAYLSNCSDKVAVVLWNKSDKFKAHYSLSYPGYRQTAVDNPEGNPYSKAIAPQSLHIVIFEKQ